MTTYKRLPEYLNHRGAILEAASGHRKEFKALIEQAKSKKLKYRCIEVKAEGVADGDLRVNTQWLFIENDGVTRFDLEQLECTNMTQYYQLIINSIMEGQRQQARDWVNKMSNNQIKAALHWCLNQSELEFNQLLINSIK